MRLLAFFICCQFLSIYSEAQITIGLPLVKNFSKTEYRGGSQTWDMDQDPNGRMYFANNEGLVTYDGTYWSLFLLPNKTIIRAVKVAPNGRIYVGGQGEVGYFIPGKGGDLEFHSIVPMIQAESRSFADIWNIEILGDAVFFRASDRIFELSNQTVQVHWAPQEWVFMRQAAGKLIAQDKLNGIFQWVNAFWKPLENGKVTGSEIVHGSIPLSKDSILLISANSRRWVISSNRVLPMSNLAVGEGSYISDIKPINDEEFVLGTANYGCIVVNKDGEMVQSIANREGLQGNNILCVFRDRFGNLWVGMNNGISMIAYNSPIKFIKPNKAGELSGFASRVFNNQLYIATNDGAYTVSLSGAPEDLGFCKGNFTLMNNTRGQGYRFDEVNQSLLLAHNDGMLNITGTSASKISLEPSWLAVPVGSVLPSTKILVGNYTGLKWLNYTGSSFTATPNLKGLRESFRFIYIDNEDIIWASHPYRGIYRIKLSQDSASYSAQLFTEKEGLPSSLDNHVFKIRNRIVFGTEKGVFEFDKARSRFIPSSFLSPMLGNTPIRYLKEDQDGNIWFISGKQLGFLEINKNFKGGFRVIYFPEITGQILSGFENVYPYNRQNVFIASEKGVILLNLDKYLGKIEKPKILLSSVASFGGVDSSFFRGFSVLESGNEKKATRLSYRGNSLHFEFSSPAYGFQENIEYSYMLEGYDKEWSKWNSKPEKDYTFLPNGAYVFKVKGRNNLGIETDFAAFAFTVAPPWYKSGLAFTIYLLLIGVLIYLLGYYHRKKMERQKRVYEERQEQLRVIHQLEIEKNEKEIIRLQNEKLANEVSYKSRELADTTMHLVERSDALEKVKETLQKLYKQDNANIDLKRALHLMNDIERNNTDWDRFSASFDEINNDFLKKLKSKYPILTNNDLKLCAYLQLNLSSKEISQLLNISLRGVEISRYRLRKKLGISTDVSISDFLNNEL
jgi:ligand-binding sensor domain-containing protein/DNA-binding CsgD family transcriptional regulator